METPSEMQRMFRCPRCWHTELQTEPRQTHCPRCGLKIPRPDRVDCFSPREPRLMLRQM